MVEALNEVKGTSVMFQLYENLLRFHQVCLDVLLKLLDFTVANNWHVVGAATANAPSHDD